MIYVLIALVVIALMYIGLKSDSHVPTPEVSSPDRKLERQKEIRRYRLGQLQGILRRFLHSDSGSEQHALIGQYNAELERLLPEFKRMFDPIDYRILYGKLVNNESYRQIGEEIGVHKHTVGRRFFRAIERFVDGK